VAARRGPRFAAELIVDQEKRIGIFCPEIPAISQKIRRNTNRKVEEVEEVFRI
jgi:hypothetical protein